jgi:hypothetical protein
MAKQIKIQFADDNYAKGGITYSEWSKDDYWQEQFQEWMEDGNVSKNADGTYSTQDAQYTNSLRGIRELRKYFYNEFIKGQYDNYADGGSANDKHLIAKAIEFIIGSAIETDSIEIEPTKISHKRKNTNVRTSIDKKLIEDTIRMHGKSLKGRFQDGGDTNYFSKKLTNFSELKNHPLVESIEKEFNRNFNPNDEYDNEFNYVLYLKEPYVFSADNKYWKSIIKSSKSELFTAFNEMLPIIDESEAEYRASGEYEYAKGGEAGFDDAGTSMVMYHEKKGNWFVPKGQVYLYLYDVEDSGSKLGEEFDWVFYPLTSQNMAWQSGYSPPLKKIWTKKFQKDHKGSEHLLGVIKAYLIEEDGKNIKT